MMPKQRSMEKQSLIKKQNLNPHNYTISLMNEGSRLGLIGQQAQAAIQAQIMTLLGDLIIRFTSGESTSLKVETAQRILLSLLYSMDACLYRFKDPEAALAMLKTHQIRGIYEKGLDLVASTFTETRSLYENIKNTKLDISIKAYHATIDEALPQFFDKYDMIYQAQDVMVTMDYPLLFDDMRVQGIFYINQYLKKLSLETDFCRLFPPDDLEKVLFNYGRMYSMDYREALINAFEVVLTNAIFSMLSTGKAGELSISRNQYKILEEKFNDLDDIQCNALINEGIDALLYALKIDQPQFKNYIRNFQSLLLPRLVNALEHNCLDKMMVLTNEELPQAEIVFDQGERMNNDSFRQLVDDIIESSEAQEKAAIVSSRIHSLEDFIDLLEADCIFGNEFTTIFSTLGDMELSLLARITFFEEVRSNPTGFSLLKAFENPREIQWQIEYCRFLQELSAARLNTIEKYIHSTWYTTGLVLC